MQQAKKHLSFVIQTIASVALCALPLPTALLAEEPPGLAQSEQYFPDTVGSHWEYRGQITEGPVQTIDHKFFTNVSKVTGTKSLNGMVVTVFHDSNPGNHGPSDSYYRRDAVGIVYHGSDPGTPLEKQLIPYQIVRFPLKMSAPFTQFNKTDLDFGTDMDRDGINEKVDAQGDSAVIGQESVTVPAGTFPDAVKVEARMQMKIHLSSVGKTASGSDVMTAWFAKGVGLVKYVERQELSPLGDRGMVTEITEELVSYEVKKPTASFGGSESSAQSLFADNPRDHELPQILPPARFRSDS